MIEIEEIKGIKITPPKLWVVLMVAVAIYCLWTGDVDTVIEILKKIK
jgi:hypothetical protein